MLGALTFALKMAMAALPNIHPVALMLILCTLVFSWRAFFTCGIYVMLEGIFFGLSPYFIAYLYIWPLLVLLTLLFRKRKHPLFWALFSAVYGFLFGLMVFPVAYFAFDMIGNRQAIVTYLLNDIPFNLYHAAGNFFMVLVLLMPLKEGLERALRAVQK